MENRSDPVDYCIRVSLKTMLHGSGASGSKMETRKDTERFHLLTDRGGGGKDEHLYF